MFKKISAILAGASLLVAGFGAMPASAAGAPDVLLANMGHANFNVTYELVNDQLTIPANQANINVFSEWYLNSSFINSHKGQVLTYSTEVRDKDGNVVPSWAGDGGLSPVVSIDYADGSINTNAGGQYYWWATDNNEGNSWQTPSAGYTNVSGPEFTIPADGGGITYLRLSIGSNVVAGNPLDWTRTLPAGTYSFVHKMFADGVEFTEDQLAGVTKNMDTVNGNGYGLSFTVPTGLSQYSGNNFSASFCADPAKIAPGDNLKAELYIDGVLVNDGLVGQAPAFGNIQPLTRTGSKTGEAGYRGYSGTGVDTAVVTQFDDDWGLAFNAWYHENDRNNYWAAGSAHTAAVKLFNTATNVDVSGSCMPQKTGVPTLVVAANGDYEVEVTDGLYSNNTLCILYDKAAPTKMVSYTGTRRSDLNVLYNKCTFDKRNFIVGHVYEVDTVAGFNNRFGYAQGATSDGSQPALNGAGGQSAGGGTGNTVQTITFAAPAASKAWVGSSNLDLTASSSSTLAISYSSSTPSVCTVDASGHVTAIAAGDCTITASNAGNATYAPNSKTVTFAIAATQPTGSTVQTITFTAPTSATAYVGSEAINLGVTSNSGIAVTYTSSTPSVCTVDPATGHVTALTAGDCTITASSAGNETYAPNSKTVTFAIGAAAAGTTEQTFSLSVPAHPTAGLEGFDLSGTSSSGLAIIYTSPTPDVCTVDKTGHVTTLKAGTCTITASQAGNGKYAPKSQTVTFTIEAQSSAAVTEADNPAKPTVLPKTGAWVQSRETYVSWNRTKGLLGIKIKVLYIGPVKATATFKVGSKSYSCVVNFGLLKKQASSKLLTLTAPTFCLGKTEKTQLALLKKIKSGTVVTIVINREWRYPTTYIKIRPWKRTMYVKLG